MKDANLSALLGIGNDIIEIERIRSSLETHGLRFISKLFTTEEQDYCLKYKDPVPHFAGRFAAKEAVVKALGTGFGAHASWLDVIITNDSAGKPVVRFSENLKVDVLNTSVFVSISHCKLYVTAVAIWMKNF
jgi:holo-[acyl-carrier protein] synthase